MIASYKTIGRSSALLLMVTFIGCGRPEESQRFTLYQDKVERIEGCHIVMSAAPGKGKVPIAAMQFVCNVPEAALKQSNWWGEQTEPLAFTVSPGDCLLLGETFYCAENIKLGEVTFKATFKWATRHHDHLELLGRR